MEPLQPGDPERIGRYRLQGRLGAGEMGVVFLGTTPEGVQAAVKIIRDELAGDTAFRQRFRREVSAAVSVAGMFTARVLDADPDADPPWLATQFVDAPSLRDAVERYGPLDPPALLRLTHGLAEALAAIHAAGLVHRDLKPGNVLLSPTGPKVIDFGIARSEGATQLTGTGDVIGTPEYMAPEQLTDSGGGSPASDVFALGSTIAFAATGRSPFAAEQGAAAMYRIVHVDPDLTGVPPEVAGVVRACLDKSPVRRPSAQQVAVSLRGGPQVVPPGDLTVPTPGAITVVTPAAPPGGKVRSRRPLVVAALAAGAVTLAGAGAAAGTTLLRRDDPLPAPPPVTATSAATTTPAGPPIDPNSPEAKYVDRLCASGDLLTTLGSSAPNVRSTDDAEIAKRDFLTASDRSIGVVDAATSDFGTLRDDAPNEQVAMQFGLIVREFTSAREAFVDARAQVAQADPMTAEVYAAAVARFTDGVRNLSLAATIVQGITLPPQYTAASAVAPNCND
ncbi:serine/threonine-protein kinase [Actinomycetes bacterium KLBMP 9759]